MDVYNDYIEVTILTTVFKNLLNSLSFSDSKVILKAWKQMGLQNTVDPSKNGNRRVLRSIEEAVYIINLENIDIRTFDNESDTEIYEIGIEQNVDRESATE